MPIRILIAEDNPAVRTALHTLLADGGRWEIVEVENGQDAIAKAQDLKPNLIILDLVMPVMDGLRAAREISKLLPQTPMLMYTMHWSPQVEVEAQKVGVRKVVPKADNRLLLSLVQQFLAEAPSPAIDTPATIASSIPTADVASAPPILESGVASTADPAEVPAPEESGDTPKMSNLN
jgi:CheY-like chemotaxis protein